MISGILQFLYFFMGILFFLFFSSGKKLLRVFALTVGAGTLLVHFGYLLQRSLQAGRPPLTNMYETLHLLAFLITLFFFIGRLWRSMDLIGGFAGMTSAILLASSAIASPEIEPLLPALKSNWLLFHVTTCFFSYSSFALAMGTGLAYLLIDVLRPKRFGKGSGLQGLLDSLDRLTYELISFGYPLLTLGIVTGSIWAELSWGRYWNWDPKETWALVTWLIYTAYLHLQADQKISKRITAGMSVMAFGIVMFTYYGVNFWLASLHDYA